MMTLVSLLALVATLSAAVRAAPTLRVRVTAAARLDVAVAATLACNARVSDVCSSTTELVPGGREVALSAELAAGRTLRDVFAVVIDVRRTSDGQGPGPLDSLQVAVDNGPFVDVTWVVTSNGGGGGEQIVTRWYREPLPIGRLDVFKRRWLVPVQPNSDDTAFDLPLKGGGGGEPTMAESVALLRGPDRFVAPAPSPMSVQRTLIPSAAFPSARVYRRGELGVVEPADLPADFFADQPSFTVRATLATAPGAGGRILSIGRNDCAPTDNSACIRRTGYFFMLDVSQQGGIDIFRVRIKCHSTWNSLTEDVLRRSDEAWMPSLAAFGPESGQRQVTFQCEVPAILSDNQTTSIQISFDGAFMSLFQDDTFAGSCFVPCDVVVPPVSSASIRPIIGGNYYDYESFRGTIQSLFVVAPAVSQADGAQIEQDLGMSTSLTTTSPSATTTSSSTTTAPTTPLTLSSATTTTTTVVSGSVATSELADVIADAPVDVDDGSDVLIIALIACGVTALVLVAAIAAVVWRKRQARTPDTNCNNSSGQDDSCVYGSASFATVE